MQTLFFSILQLDKERLVRHSAKLFEASCRDEAVLSIHLAMIDDHACSCLCGSSPTTKEFFMKKRLTVLFCFAILLGALLACGESSNTGSLSSTSDNTPQTQSTPAVQHFKVGDMVKVGDTWQVTVNKVKTSHGDDIIQPESGNIFVIINVSVKNISSQAQSISSLLNFSYKAADGTKGKDSTLTSGVSPSPDGTVEAGDVVKGDLVYEVPASQKTGTLSFQADIIANGETIWDIKL
jgi:hypothetical protein